MTQHQNHYRLVRPCQDCPFRSDRPFLLEPGRVEEIRRSTQLYPFSCHQTVDYEGTRPPEYEYGHCAGALILREKLGEPSLVMLLARECGVYDPQGLDMASPVYDSWDSMERCTER